jgi:large repetitive protein
MFGRIAVIVSCLAFALPSSATITGVVVNPGGAAISGARLTAYALETADQRRARHQSGAERKALAEVESAKNGTFSIDVPKEHAVVALKIVAPGHAPIEIRAERDDETGAITIRPAESKRGRITATGNGVAGARVIWTAQSEVVTTTDAEGYYVVPDPALWANNLTVIHPDYAIVEGTRTRAGLAIDQTLVPGVTVTGRLLSSDGKVPVAGAEVAVDGWTLTRSGEDGSFTIAHAPNDWSWITAKSGTLAGRRAKTDKEPAIRLQPTATISGTIRDVKSSAPIAGAEVTLVQRARMGGGRGQSAITDSKGNFTIDDVPPGNHMLMAVRPRYDIARVDASAAAGAKAHRELTATRRARIVGLTVDEESRPVAGARLSEEVVSRSRGSFFFMPVTTPPLSGPDGAFVIDVTPNADLEVQARKKGLPEARSSRLQLGDGERKAGVVITMPSGIAVSGRVTNRDGQALSGVEVRAAETTPGANMAIRQVVMMARRERSDDAVTTGPDGTFTVMLKEGKYDFAFSREGFATATVRSHEVNRAPKPIEVTLEPGVTLSGRVTRNGTGVPGVFINLMSDSIRENTETGADGSFVISDLTPGRAMLSASKSDEFIRENRQVTIPADDIAIEIRPGGRISGRVVDKETKAPVTAFDAGVSSSPGGGAMVFMAPPQQQSFTTDDGTFVLENVPAGVHSVVVNAAGYTAAVIPSVSVEEGKSAPEVTVEMDRGARITGRVTSTEGSPISGVEVRVNPASGRLMRLPSFASSAITDANGQYSIEAVEPGERSLLFERRGYVRLEKTAEVKPRETRVDAELSSGLRVSGTVVTEAGAPVSDARVGASSSAAGANEWLSTRTDSNGSFTLEALAPGRYTFRASKEGYPPSELSDVDVASGAPIRLIVKGGATIYGRVTGLSPEELSNVYVSARTNSGGSSAAVDSGGSYRIEGAPTGTIRLSAQTQQNFGMGGRRSNEKTVQVEAGSVVQADIEFQAGTTIRGRVTREGQPVTTGAVSFYPNSSTARTTARTTTDSNGNYEVTGLEDGKYTVNAADFARTGSVSMTYEVRGPGTFDIDMRTSIVRGRVVDADTGQGVGGAAVSLRRKDEGFFGLRTFLTDPAGSFIAEGIGIGTYDVSAEKTGYGTKVVELDVAGGPAEVEVKLAPESGVMVRVYDARDGRTLSARLRVTDAQERVVYESPFGFGRGSGSEMTNIGLARGTYQLQVSADGYATRRLTIQSPGSQEIPLSPGGTILVRSQSGERRIGRLLDAQGRPHSRSVINPTFLIDPSPGVTTIDHIPPGMYTLQILGRNDEVISSAQVGVAEGQTASVDI